MNDNAWIAAKTFITLISFGIPEDF